MNTLLSFEFSVSALILFSNLPTKKLES